MSEYRELSPTEEPPVEPVEAGETEAPKVEDPVQETPVEAEEKPVEAGEKPKEEQHKNGSQRAKEARDREAARADANEAKALELQQKLDAILNQNAVDPNEPKYEDFDDLEVFKAAVREYGEKVGSAKAEAALKARIAAEETAKYAESWKSKDAEYAKSHPDFYDSLADLKHLFRELRAEAPESMSTMDMAISDSDNFSAIKHYLGNNPEEVKRLAKLTPLRVVKEIDRIEAKLAQKKPEPKPVSNAPAPITPIPNGASPVEKSRYRFL